MTPPTPPLPQPSLPQLSVLRRRRRCSNRETGKTRCVVLLKENKLKQETPLKREVPDIWLKCHEFGGKTWKLLRWISSFVPFSQTNFLKHLFVFFFFALTSFLNLLHKRKLDVMNFYGLLRRIVKLKIFKGPRSLFFVPDSSGSSLCFSRRAADELFPKGVHWQSDSCIIWDLLGSDF